MEYGHTCVSVSCVHACVCVLMVSCSECLVKPNKKKLGVDKHDEAFNSAFTVFCVIEPQLDVFSLFQCLFSDVQTGAGRFGRWVASQSTHQDQLGA